MITSYTTYDDIRAALGVSSEEIEDSTIGLALYENKLLEQFEEIDEDLVEDFLNLPGSPSEDQRRFARSVQMFATYAVAKHLTISLPLFSPKDMTDSKAGYSRYASSPYRDTIVGVSEEFDRRRLKLEAVYAALNAVTVVPTIDRNYFGVAPHTPDPVTGV